MHGHMNVKKLQEMFFQELCRLWLGPLESSLDISDHHETVCNPRNLYLAIGAVLDDH